jgi:hypothetical protein
MMSKHLQVAVGVVVLAIFALLLVSAAAYLAPRCKPGDPGTRWGGMLMAGCRR